MRERCPICRPCWGVRAHNSRFSNVCVSCLVVSNSLQPHRLYPPGPSVHGILQARTLEWVAISFSKRNYRKKESEVGQSCPTLCNPMDCMQSTRLLHPWNFPCRQEYCSGLPFPSPDLRSNVTSPRGFLLPPNEGCLHLHHYHVP